MNLKLHVERPVAAAVLLAATVVLLGLILAAEVADLSSALVERDAKAEFVTRSLRTPRSGQADLSGTGTGTTLAVVAESETLAAANLDTLVRSTVVDAGGAVMSSQTEAKHDETGIGGRMEAQAVIEGPIEAIQKALYRLENGTPLVLVDEIAMQPVEASGPTGGDPQAPTLHATMTLSAYWTAPTPRR